MVYSGDLKSPVERHTGSSPVSRTKQLPGVRSMDRTGFF